MKIQLRAKCPTCGEVREVLARDGFKMMKHRRTVGDWRLRPPYECKGGVVTSAEVVEWLCVARDVVAKNTAEVEAYDRVIERIEKKVTT